ncbi:MAG: hypothetical protein ABIO44_07625, partial [Saprospiraceae bacterium]
MNKKLYNYIVATICFIITGYMASLMSTEKLWSNLPLVLFLSIWIGFVLLVDLKLSSTRNTNNSLILSALSGLLLSLAFPPFGFTPLILFAFIPLFYLQDKKEIDKSHSSFYIYNALVLWNILDTYWVANAAIIPGIVAIWLNSFFMLIPW